MVLQSILPTIGPKLSFVLVIFCPLCALDTMTTPTSPKPLTTKNFEIFVAASVLFVFAFVLFSMLSNAPSHRSYHCRYCLQLLRPFPFFSGSVCGVALWVTKIYFIYEISGTKVIVSVPAVDDRVRNLNAKETSIFVFFLVVSIVDSLFSIPNDVESRLFSMLRYCCCFFCFSKDDNMIKNAISPPKFFFMFFASLFGFLSRDEVVVVRWVVSLCKISWLPKIRRSSMVLTYLNQKTL